MTVYAVKTYYNSANDEIEYQILPYNLRGTVRAYLKYYGHVEIGLFYLFKFLAVCRFTEKGAMKLKKKLEKQ